MVLLLFLFTKAWNVCRLELDNIRWQVHLWNQLFHVDVRDFSKEKLRVFLSSTSSWISPRSKIQLQNKGNNIKLSIIKYSLFFNFFHFLLENFQVFFNCKCSISTTVAARCNGRRRPSQCTQVTQCMWGFAIWIQFSLPSFYECNVNPGRAWQQKINLIHE